MSRLSQIEHKQNITTDDILNASCQGRNIWERELGNLPQHKNISSPFRTDKNPSFRVKPSKTTGIYIGTDYTTGEVFNPFQFIAKLYNLEFKDVINKLSWDFGLKNKNGDINYEKISQIITPKKQIIIEKPILYEYQSMSFTKEAHKYWGVLEEDFLNENFVYQCSKYAVNKKVIDAPKDELMFVYKTGDPKETRLQFLRIGKNVSKADKWRKAVPNTYCMDLHLYENKHVENLFISKSRKDQLVLKLLGYDSISCMSENAVILDQNMPKIIEVCDNQWINYGSDEDGKLKSIEVQQKYKKTCKWFNTPNNLVTNEITDNFSYAQSFGLKSLNNLIQNKLNKQK